MKHIASFLLIAIATTMIVFTGCEGPQGPPGQDGKDGDPGMTSTYEGFAPGLQCGVCHTPDIDSVYFVTARRYQWERSKHYLGGAIERNAADCAGCHSTEGFIIRAKRGSASPQTVPAQLNPTPPNCFSCHSPHMRGDFTLRSTDPVVINSNITGIPNATFDYGKGNMCVWCHQTRTMTPQMPSSPAPTDTVTIRTSRWYAHYGVQGQMLMGDGGYLFPGYQYRGNSNHQANQTLRQEGCAACHMADPAPGAGAGRGGGHTMNIRYTTTGTDTLFILSGCNTSGCHGTNGITKASLLAAEKTVTDSLHALEDMLIALNWLNPTTKLVNASSSSPLRITPAVKAGALYNYFFVEHDLSRGVHNTKYAEDLVNSSLWILRQP